eukprot:scaffold192706_cov47-Prasinocladus_malaysianus.AAC.1
MALSSGRVVVPRQGKLYEYEQNFGRSRIALTALRLALERLCGQANENTSSLTIISAHIYRK